MTRARETAPLRVGFATDAADHLESRAILEWLTAAPGIEARPLGLEEAASSGEDVVWIHGVHPIRLEALGGGGPEMLIGGGVLLSGGAAALPAAAGVDAAAPNDVGRVAWPAGPEDDGLPPLRGHASLRGHPLLAGLGAAVTTWAPAPGEEHTRVTYVLPSWPERGRVIAVTRSRTRVHAEQATAWEYDGSAGRTVCVGAFLPLHGPHEALTLAARRVARNALGRAAERPDGGAAEEHRAWRRPDPSAREDRGLAIPELPLLEDALGSLDFRLRTTRPAREDAPFHVAGRRAFAVGGGARGLDEVWAHPLRLASGLRLRGGAGESVTVTPLGVERRVRMAGALVLERVAVPREAPGCVVEWESRSRTAEVEVGWTCDLRLAAPYPPGALGPLRWRRAARGLVVAAGDERAVFAFSVPPESLEVEDASRDGRPLVRVRARLRLVRRTPVRLAVAGAAGEQALRRALAAADRTAALARSRRGAAERLMTERLALEDAPPAAIQELEWAKQRLEASLAEAPGVGRSLLNGYGSSPRAPFDDAAPLASRYPGPAAARGALAACAAGNARVARDVLVFLGRHLDAAGRAPRECSTSGVARHDAPEATPLYLLLAARYLAWTGDLATLRTEWPVLFRAVEALLRVPRHGEDREAAELTGGALAELADAAESIGEREAALELRGAAAARAGERWSVDPGVDTAIGALVHGVLGAEPDAPRGRLVLRPEPPAEWHRFRATGLAVGGAVIDVGYRREADRHTFRLSQGRGPAPLRVVLEPLLPGRALRSARVDGVEADLVARPRGDKLIVPVQVVLDHAREIVLELDAGTETERRLA